MFARYAWQLLFIAALGLLLARNTLAEETKIKNEKLNESSGLAFSTRSKDVLFSHNDSGDEPRLYCFDRDGKTLGEIKVEGAQAIDWEDMCSFKRGDKHWLAVADTGDNERKRKSVSIYLFEEPKIKQDDQKYKVSVACELQVTYPNGMLDCEALAYDSLTDSMVLITKELLTCDLLQVPMPTELQDLVKVQAEIKHHLAIPYVTGADISRDAKQLAICTYGPACVLNRSNSSPDKPWSKTEENAIEFFEVPPRKQGEAICFEPDGDHLWFTSEHVPTPLIKVKLPTR